MNTPYGGRGGTLTTTERKGLGHLEWQSFPLAPKALKQPLSDMCRDQVRASLENPERVPATFDAEYLHGCLFHSLP